MEQKEICKEKENMDTRGLNKEGKKSEKKIGWQIKREGKEKVGREEQDKIR